MRDQNHHVLAGVSLIAFTTPDYALAKLSITKLNEVQKLVPGLQLEGGFSGVTLPVSFGSR